jgi:hypothetical protein
MALLARCTAVRFRIASITGVNGPSFGFSGGLVRW